MIKKERGLLIIMMVTLSLMLIMRDVWNVAINKYLFLAFVAGCMALASYPTLVNMICFILPLVCGLPSTYIMAVAVLLLIFKRGLLNLVSIFLVVCLSMLEIIASFWYPEMDIALIIQYVSFLAVLVLLTHNTAELDYEQGIRMYLYGVLLLCGVIVVVTIKDAPKDWLDRFARGAFRFGVLEKATEGEMTLTLNNNSLAYYSITGITCGIFMAERCKGVARVAYIAIAVFTAAAGFFTVSRSWMLVVGLCLILFTMRGRRSPKQIFAVLGVMLALVSIIVIVLQQNPRLMDGFVARFTNDDVEGANGRVELFNQYMELYFDNPRYILFGTGVTQYREMLKAAASIHNGTQQILVCTGIVGFVLYLCILIGPLLQMKKYRKRTITAWLPLLGVVVFTQTIQFLNPMMLMLPYIIGIFTLRADSQSLESSTIQQR